MLFDRLVSNLKTTVRWFLGLDDLELDISLEAEVPGVLSRAMMDVDSVYESRVHRILDEEDLGTIERR